MVNWKPHHLKCHWKTCVFYHFCVSLADVVSSARLLFTFPYYTGRTHRSCLYSEALYELLDRGLDDATVLHKMKVSLAQIQKLLIFWDGNVLFSVNCNKCSLPPAMVVFVSFRERKLWCLSTVHRIWQVHQPSALVFKGASTSLWLFSLVYIPGAFLEVYSSGLASGFQKLIKSHGDVRKAAQVREKRLIVIF